MTTTQLSAAPTVGGRIAQARRWTGMSQAALAEIVGVSRVTVTSWENGKTSPTVEQLLALAPALDLSPAWFVEGLTGEFGWTYGSPPGRYTQLSWIGGTHDSDDRTPDDALAVAS